MRISLAIIALVLLVGCGQKDWGNNPYLDSLTTSQPKQQDIVGSYLLTRQTITTNGMSIFEGLQCQLDLRADGSFAATNYPTWEKNKFASLISTSDRWRSEVVGSVYDNKPVWGIRFSDADLRLGLLSFTGKAAPYGLLMTYGDPDEGAVMLFEKKK